MNVRYFRRGIERLKCFFGGHREVARAAAYAEEIPGRRGGDWELRYCGACGAPVWIKTQHPAAPPSWHISGSAK